MSQPDPSKKAGATFTWVLGAFAGFAVLFILIQALSDSKQGYDPRADERSANTAEILKAQNENIAKLGLNDAKKKAEIFENTVKALAEKKTAVSTQVVPGSPTQLKQAAAASAPAAPVPTAAPAASTPPPPVPASTPPPPVPATAPAVPAPAAPAPAPAPAPAAPATPAAPAPPPVPSAPAPAPAAPASPQ